jgi:hypothetical protein
MAYTIYNNNGTVLSTIAIGEVDSFSTSLDLIGKNVNNYGEYYNNNLVRLLTSFASPDTEQPRSPQVGQMWFDKTSKRLKVYDGVSFQPTYGSHVSGTQPVTTSTGDFWYDTVNTQLKVWNGNSYNLVGPSTSGLLGKFGTLPSTFPIRDNNSKLAQKAGVINSYGSYVGLWTTSSFTMEASSSTVYLGSYSINNIHEGLTIFKDLDVKRDIYSGNINVGGSVRSYAGSMPVTSNVPTSIPAALNSQPGGSIYLVSASYSSSAYIVGYAISQNTSMTISVTTSSGMSFSSTNLNLNINQTSGNTQTVNWSILRIN